MEKYLQKSAYCYWNVEFRGAFSLNVGRKGGGLDDDDDDVSVGDDDDDVGRWVDVGSVKVVELKASTALSSSSSTANSHQDHHHTHHHSHSFWG